MRPYSWFAAVLLFLSYVVGLLFTLRTHAATIWNSELDEKERRLAQQAAPVLVKHPSAEFGLTNGGGHLSSQMPTPTTPTNPKADIRETQLYKRILGQSLQQAGIPNQSTGGEGRAEGNERARDTFNAEGTSSLPNAAPGDARTSAANRRPSLTVPGLSQDDSKVLVRHMAEMAATAAAVAARDATQNPRRASALARTAPPTAPSSAPTQAPQTPTTDRAQAPPVPLQQKPPTLPVLPEDPSAPTSVEAPSGGHDAPNWGRVKSYTVLLSATLAYAVIAEILVSTVDAVLANVDIDEKFLGITLFALVPNTTEFLNAISFAMNGNIALSMEIGSAYALQVCLLQIPALVLFSAFHGRFIDPQDVVDHTFSLIFPQWDMVTVILCVFLLSYMYGEGKSNYFKGSILILSYLVVIVGFYLTGVDNMSMIDRDFGNGKRRQVSSAVYRGYGSSRAALLAQS